MTVLQALRPGDHLLLPHDMYFGIRKLIREVFIPWGAAHLPDIEARLLERGFVQQDEIIRPIVRFGGKPSPATAVLPAAAKSAR